MQQAGLGHAVRCHELSAENGQKRTVETVRREYKGPGTS